MQRLFVGGNYYVEKREPTGGNQIRLSSKDRINNRMSDYDRKINENSRSP